MKDTGLTVYGVQRLDSSDGHWIQYHDCFYGFREDAREVKRKIEGLEGVRCRIVKLQYVGVIR